MEYEIAGGEDLACARRHVPRQVARQSKAWLRQAKGGRCTGRRRRPARCSRGRRRLRRRRARSRGLRTTVTGSGARLIRAAWGPGRLPPATRRATRRKSRRSRRTPPSSRRRVRIESGSRDTTRVRSGHRGLELLVFDWREVAERGVQARVELLHAVVLFVELLALENRELNRLRPERLSAVRRRLQQRRSSRASRRRSRQHRSRRPRGVRRALLRRTPGQRRGLPRLPGRGTSPPTSASS